MADELDRHRDAHGLIHRDALEVDVEELALDGLVLPIDDHGLHNRRALDVQIEDGVVAGV